jgi:selenide,water dikinase
VPRLTGRPDIFHLRGVTGAMAVEILAARIPVADGAAALGPGARRARRAVRGHRTDNPASDAYTFGRIAAVSALSGIYAMGGEPLVAVNLPGWPRQAPG